MEVDQNEEMMTSVERRLLSESGSVVCFTTSEGGGEKGIKRRVISFPWSLGMSVQSHRAGLDPFTTQSEGQGLENFLFLHPPHSHSLHPSFFHLLPMHKHVSTNTCTYDALTYTLHHSCVYTHQIPEITIP